jgi:hypothetical protein
MFGCNLYELTGGKLGLVNVLPGAEATTVPNATFGGYAGVHDTGPLLTETLESWTEELKGSIELTNFSHAISDDGRRIFWTDTQPGPDMEHVFLRENGTSTIPVSAGAAEYWTASPDGRYAFYTETGVLWRFDTETHERTALTPSSHSATGAGQLTAGSEIVASVVTTSGAFHVGAHIVGSGIPTNTTVVAVAGGTLTLSRPVLLSGSDVTIATGGSEVQGVIGANETGEDGSYVYFVADGGLTPGTTQRICMPQQEQGTESERLLTHGLISEEEYGAIHVRLGEEGAEETEGKSPRQTGCDLYVWHDDAITHIADLAPEDNNIVVTSGFVSGHSGDWAANVGARLAEVAPDGTHLLFESHRSLTGYDNRGEGEAGAAGRTIEVYVYSAEAASIACASCDPNGVPPSEHAGIKPGDRADARLPLAPSSDTFGLHLMSRNGARVFFVTVQALVPRDTNDLPDVYEWEREGEGTCTRLSPARLNAGCVYLLSGGSGVTPSLLVDADATGENVFFEHIGPLGQVQGVPSDQNLLYDARVGGGFQPPSLTCVGAGCQAAPPTPPTFSSPSTTSFEGLGNYVQLATVAKKPAARPLTRAQHLTLALKACTKLHQKARRKACERLARKRYGPPVKKAAAKHADRSHTHSNKARAGR